MASAISLIAYRTPYICSSCRLKLLPLLAHRPASTSSKSPPPQPPPEDYYSLLLSNPLPTPSTTTSSQPSSSTTNKTTPTSASTKAAAAARASVVFGSRLAGPAARARRDAASTLIAGVLVPPRPDEPDNCCMSGCVNCVWDTYRDDVEEWAAARKEARRREWAAEGKRRMGDGIGRRGLLAEAARSMDDDGGGSETNWEAGGEEEGLFEGVPVGIREFMRTEKLLKERHRMEERAR